MKSAGSAIDKIRHMRARRRSPAAIVKDVLIEIRVASERTRELSTTQIRAALVDATDGCPFNDHAANPLPRHCSVELRPSRRHTSRIVERCRCRLPSLDGARSVCLRCDMCEATYERCCPSPLRSAMISTCFTSALKPCARAPPGLRASETLPGTLRARLPAPSE